MEDESGNVPASVIRVLIDGRAFRALVKGQEIRTVKQTPKHPVVYIMLEDIGWDVMRAAIDDAEEATSR